ncbi:hypothetical protein Tco_0767539, partial [Tanacetum coccineum]
RWWWRADDDDDDNNGGGCGGWWRRVVMMGGWRCEVCGCGGAVYNRRTKKVMETMNATFDELSAMAFEQRSSKPELQARTSGHISSGLDLTYALSTITSQKPTEHDLELLFEAMYDDYMGGQQSDATKTAPTSPATLNLQTPNASTTTVETTPRPTNSSTEAPAIPNSSQDVDELQQQHHFQQ